MDLMTTLRAQGLSLRDPAGAKMYEALHNAYVAAVTEALGTDGEKLATDFEQELPARQAMIGFAGTAAVNGIPLSQEQMDQLNAIAAQNSHSQSPQSGPNPIDWNGIETQAASVLSPNQLALLKAGEFRGPVGFGSRYQNQLNDAISAADQADVNAKLATAHPP